MGIHEAVKSAYLSLGEAVTNNRLGDIKWLAEQEANSWTNWVDLPIPTRLWLWSNGFPSPYGKLYDFDTYGREPFLSELQRYRFYRSINGQHRYLVDDKLSLHWMLSNHPSNRPAAHGVIDRGRIHGISGSDLEGGPLPVADVVPSLLRDRGKLVVKQLRGEGGKEVLLCAYDNGFVLDGEPVSEAALCEVLSGLSGYLVTDHVAQHDYADRLYPHSPNTVRLLTIWDDEAGTLFTPFAAQRIGTERSRPIDNFSAGGLTAEIDLETGRIGEAAQFPYGGEVSWYRTHPATGAPIEGARVPDWDRIRSTVEAIAIEHTNVPAIGWDVIVDRNGDPIIIEANTGTGFDMLQVHRPLLQDPRMARVASRHLDDVDPSADHGLDRRHPVPVAQSQ